ncbi:MAG: DUF1559 domain-containing protein [Planctomycetaceae bacterium]|nr:DUF1559 domain-containing protein [Planctomycetaceae bacterium]
MHFFCPLFKPLENHSRFGTINNGNGVPRSQTQRGAFAPTTYLGLNAIVDGTSNTLMFGERCLAEYRAVDKGPGRVKETMFCANPSTGIGLSYGNWGTSGRINCFATTTDGIEYRAATDSEKVYHSYGWAYAIGQAWHTVFTAAMPPNSPSCVDSDGSRGYVSSVTVSSYHSGGVNVTLMDGAVRFVSETIDCGPTNAGFPTYNSPSGPSPFGVWGAYGTRDAGETVTL